MPSETVQENSFEAFFDILDLRLKIKVTSSYLLVRTPSSAHLYTLYISGDTQQQNIKKQQKQIIMIDYSIYMQSNPMDETAAPKAYAKAQMREAVTFDGFVTHIAEHNGVFSRGTVKGVISDACVCIVEHLLDGKKVQLGELGNFWISLSSNGTPTLEDFTAKNIKAVNIVFTPGDDFENLIDRAKFNLVASRVAQAATLKAEKTGGTVVDLEAAKAASRPNSSSTSGGSGSSGSGSGTETPTVSQPTISGTSPFAESTSVTITGPAGATLYYTLDGTNPTASSQQYSAALTLTSTTTVKAVAIKDGVSSSVASRTFTKNEGGGSENPETE